MQLMSFLGTPRSFGLAEVFFIKRPCDAQALIAKERGALGG